MTTPEEVYRRRPFLLDSDGVRRRPFLLDSDGVTYHRQGASGPWCRPFDNFIGYRFTSCNENSQRVLGRRRCEACWSATPPLETPVNTNNFDSPFDAQPHVLLLWGGDEDRPDVDEAYGPFPSRQAAEQVMKRIEPYIGSRVWFEVKRLTGPKPEDLPSAPWQPAPAASVDPLEQARQIILDEVDIVSLVASLDPNEMGMGDYAYSPVTRRVITKVKLLSDLANKDEDEEE